MNLNIYCFGKIDDKNTKNLVEQFMNKISFYAKINVFEYNENFSSDLKNNQQKNEELILSKNLDWNSTFLMDINSKMVTSIEFAKEIENFKNYGKTINFLIGPSDGFSEEFKTKFSQKISFGKITFPHQIFRLVLMEQIYRSFKIINNEKYHK